MEAVNVAVTGKTKADMKTEETNRMIKLLSIASGKTTAEQEAEVGSIPYSQYIKQKEAEKNKNTVENDGEEAEKTVLEDGAKYSIKMHAYTENEIEDNVNELAKMSSVYDVPAERLEKTGKRVSDIFAEFFNSIGNNIYTDEFGDIALNRSSIKSEIRHGITAEKIASIEAIPAVLTKGKVIFAKTKPKSDVERIVVCAPITIDNNFYYMGVMLQRDSQNQRLYLHNVVIEKEMSNDTQADLLTTGADEQNEHLFITNILQKALSVKKDYMQNFQENASDKLYADSFSDEKRAKKRERVETLAEKLGLKLNWSSEVTEGKYNPKTREVTLNPNLTAGRMYMFIFSQSIQTRIRF